MRNRCHAELAVIICGSALVLVASFAGCRSKKKEPPTLSPPQHGAVIQLDAAKAAVEHAVLQKSADGAFYLFAASEPVSCDRTAQLSFEPAMFQRLGPALDGSDKVRRFFARVVITKPWDEPTGPWRPTRLHIAYKDGHRAGMSSGTLSQGSRVVDFDPGQREIELDVRTGPHTAVMGKLRVTRCPAPYRHAGQPQAQPDLKLTLGKRKLEVRGAHLTTSGNERILRIATYPLTCRSPRAQASVGTLSVALEINASGTVYAWTVAGDFLRSSALMISSEPPPFEVSFEGRSATIAGTTDVENLALTIDGKVDFETCK